MQNDNEKNAVNDALFDSTEAEIISAVLNGEKERLGVIAKENNIMLSIAIEKINEKFIELIGDNAIETIGDGYAVIEDYIEDVRNITGG